VLVYRISLASEVVQGLERAEEKEKEESLMLSMLKLVETIYTV